MDENNEGLGLRAFFDAAVSLGNNVERLGRQLDRWERLQYDTPNSIKIQASGTFVTGVPLVLAFNQSGPDAGYYWELNNFIIGGLDLNVTAAGTFGLYVGQFPIGQTTPGLTQAVDGPNTAAGGAAGMPFSETYGSRQVIVQDGERLFALVYGGTNGQVYTCVAQITVRPTSFGQGRAVTAN